MEEAKEYKSNWGGKRLSSGRKAKNRKQVTFWADEDTVELLKSVKNKSDLINDAIRSYNKGE